MADTVPQSICDLLDDLKKIKKAFSMEQEQHVKKGKKNPVNSNKQEMVSLHEPVPKKSHKDAKHVCCAKSMGVHT